MNKFLRYLILYSEMIFRLSEDVPAQSDSIPLFNIYFMGCMCSALVSLFWFYQENIFVEKESLPRWLRWLTLKFICPLLGKPLRQMVEVEIKRSKVILR